MTTFGGVIAGALVALLRIDALTVCVSVFVAVMLLYSVKLTLIVLALAHRLLGLDRVLGKGHGV